MMLTYVLYSAQESGRYSRTDDFERALHLQQAGLELIGFAEDPLAVEELIHYHAHGLI